jgi:hypothetical protein
VTTATMGDHSIAYRDVYPSILSSYSRNRTTPSGRYTVVTVTFSGDGIGDEKSEEQDERSAGNSQECASPSTSGGIIE